MSNFREAALREWNGKQPAWTKFKKYEDLTPAEQSVVDGRTEEAELLHMLLETGDSIRKMGLLTQRYLNTGKHGLNG